MFQQIFHCKEHEEEITHICLDKHECPERRLCQYCICEDRHIDIEDNILSVQEFKAQLFEKLNEETQSVPKLFINFIGYLNENIKTKNPLEFPEQDFNMMILFMQDNNGEKQSALQCVQKDSSNNDVYVANEIKIVEQVDYFTLTGQMQSGMKQGYYYLLLNDGSKINAGRYEKNQKQGIWNDYLWGEGQNIVSGYNSNKINQQIRFCGQYRNDRRQGLWKYIFEGRIIGQGFYNKQGQKFGKWIEPIEKYLDQCPVTFSGEYKNGVRIGQWNTSLEGKQIGGGKYDEKGVKSGNWIDLYDNFDWYSYVIKLRDCEVTFSGEYKNGFRIGQWNTSLEDNQIGGGKYDEKGVKSGNWIDLYDNFNWLCQVTFSGEYKNGFRIGQWNTSYEGEQMYQFREY